jgi:CheY-like chemotaxis protein
MGDRTRRLCALVVDDNQDAAESLARLLGTMGCEAVHFTDPRDALARALELKPHVAFLDIGMPHINGYELARQLRIRFPSASLKIVAITGYGGPEDRKASRHAGFDAHV